METPLWDIWARIDDRHKVLGVGCGFLLVKDLIEIESPIELAPGCVLRRATPDEADTLHDLFPQFDMTHRGHGQLNPYEYEYRFIVSQLGSQVMESHPPEGWKVCASVTGESICLGRPRAREDRRYHVLAFKNRDAIEDVLFASFVCQPTLRYLVGIDREEKTQSLWMQYAIHAENPQITLEKRLNSLFKLSTTQTTHIKEARKALVDLKVFPDMKLRIDKAFGIVRELNAVYPETRLKFLGLFTVIESLITHKPKPTDPTESLGRQIRQKMNLINHRKLRRKIPYDLFGVGGSTEKDTSKVWSALYDLRSVFAHGDSADFNSNSLKLLKDIRTASDFLESVVSILFGLCVDEPQLMLDLHSC